MSFTRALCVKYDLMHLCLPLTFLKGTGARRRRKMGQPTASQFAISNSNDKRQYQFSNPNDYLPFITNLLVLD